MKIMYVLTYNSSQRFSLYHLQEVHLRKLSLYKIYMDNEIDKNC
jgi:hypothetical protein